MHLQLIEQHLIHINGGSGPGEKQSRSLPLGPLGGHKESMLLA